MGVEGSIPEGVVDFQISSDSESEVVVVNIDRLLTFFLLLGIALLVADYPLSAFGATATGCAWYTPNIMCPNGPAVKPCNGAQPCGRAIGKIGGKFCACGPGQYDAHTAGQDPGCYRDCECIWLSVLCSFDPINNCTYFPADLWVQDDCPGG